MNLARGLSFEESADGLHTTEIHWEIDSKQSSRGPSRTSTPMWLRLGLQDVRKESTLVWHRRRGHRRTSCTSGRSLPLTPSTEPRTVWERSSKMRRLQSSCNVIPPRSRWDNGVLAYMATDDMSCHDMTWFILKPHNILDDPDPAVWNLPLSFNLHSSPTALQLAKTYRSWKGRPRKPRIWTSGTRIVAKAFGRTGLESCGTFMDKPEKVKPLQYSVFHDQNWGPKSIQQFDLDAYSFFPTKCWSMPWVWGTCRLNLWMCNPPTTTGGIPATALRNWFHLSLTPGDRTWNCSSSASHTWRRTRLAFCVSAASSLATLLFTVT